MNGVYLDVATGAPTALTFLVWVGSIAATFLIGAISFARIIGRRIIPGEDLDNLEIPIEKSKDGFRLTSVSATVLRVKAGPKWGCTTSILDMLKAALPVLALRLLFPDSPIHLYAAAAAVMGHNFPPYYRFRGGRGVSPIYGGLFVIDWLAVPAATVAGAVVSLVVLRYSFVAYFGLTLALLPWFWFRFGDLHHMLSMVIINVAFWTASIPEIREYIRHARAGSFDTGHHLVGAGPLSDGLIARWIRKRRERKAAQENETRGADEPDASDDGDGSG